MCDNCRISVVDKYGIKTLNSAIMSGMGDCPFKVIFYSIYNFRTFAQFIKQFWRRYCNKEYIMKILFILSITVLIVFAVGCDEMQNQMTKPTMMSDDEVPPEDAVVTSVGTMKEPPAETDDKKEEPATETDDSQDDSSDEKETDDSQDDSSGTPQTMEEDTTDENNVPMEDPPDVPPTPTATFVSASPTSGDISENDSITIEFDNDPGTVTASAGTVTGSGNSRTINGPFSVGPLTLTISWTNGDGSYTLNYNVVAVDTTSPSVTISSTTNGATDVDPDAVFASGITVSFNEPISSGNLMLLRNGVDVGWTASTSGRTITLTANTGQELSHETTYQIVGTVKDAADNETNVSISFTTGSAPPPPTPIATYVSASPTSGDISENDSITIEFDNDPGTVTTSAGTVTGSGNSRTINGPFSVGPLTLTISWTNGDGNHTLNYNVVAADTTSPSVTTSSITNGATDVDPDAVSASGITVTFSEVISSGNLRLLRNGVDVGWTATISGRTITLTANTGQELNHETTYQIVGTVRDAADNETNVSISFTTGSAPPPPTPIATYVSAAPTSGDISENDSITIQFDNDPGTVTASAGTVTGSGNSRTINGPFSVGPLTLTISWTNGDGNHTLNYNVVAADTTSPSVTTSSTTNGATDVDPDAVFKNGITITFSEVISSGNLRLMRNSVNVGWTASISGRTITLTANTGQELSYETTYQIVGTVRDAADNETNVSISFTTESAPPPPEPLAPGEGLRIGVEAPDFTLPDGSGNDNTLSDSIGSSNIVIVFFRGNW